MMVYNELLSKHRVAIMGGAILLIMLFHQEFLKDGLPIEWLHHLGYIGVEIFLLLSGFGIATSLERNRTGIFYRNRIVRILPACLIWGVTQTVLSTIEGLPDWKMPIVLEVFSLSHWYIYALLVYYAISPWLYRINSRIGWWSLFFFCLITYIVLLFWKDDENAFYLIEKGRWVFKRLPCFVMGMLLIQKPIRMNTWMIIVIGAGLFMINILAYHEIAVVNGLSKPVKSYQDMIMQFPNRTDLPDGGRYLLDMVSTLFLCPLLACIGAVMDRMKLSRVVVFFGTTSLELYLCHQYIYEIFMTVDVPPLICYLSAFAASIIVAYLLKVCSSKVIYKLNTVI